MTPREAWCRWLVAAGPWQGWAVCPALAALDRAPPPHTAARALPLHPAASAPPETAGSASPDPAGSASPDTAASAPPETAGSALPRLSASAPPYPSENAPPPHAAASAPLPPAANGPSLDTAANGPSPETCSSPAASVASLLHPLTRSLANGPTLVVLDLDVCLGIRLAAELFRQSLAHPVLLIPRWPHAQAVLPVECMLATLLHEAASLPRRHARHGRHARLPSVAFVLDEQRGLPLPGRAADDPRADNRYRLSVSDLPNLATLRARGISRILKLEPVQTVQPVQPVQTVEKLARARETTPSPCAR